MERLPLTGVRVISLTEVWAGPFATTLLGDMGAEVLHVEAIQRVAQTRGTLRPTPGTVGYPDGDPGERPWERIAGFNGVNRNKMGITIDLTRAAGTDYFLKLVQLSDIVIDNYAAGTVERMGLGYDVLSRANPQIIQLSTPGWGVDGPYRGYISFGSHVDAMVGHTYLRGYPDADPSLTSSIVHSDAVISSMAVFAVTTALNYRLRTGKGQYIDMSQAEGLMTQLGEYVLEYTMNGRVPQPLGNHHPHMAPHGVFPCRGNDRWITIAVEGDQQFARLCGVMGRPDLAEDERFATALARYQRQDEMETIIAAWTREQENATLLAQLQAAGIASGAVHNDEDLYRDPHLQARGLFQEVVHRQAGTHLYPGPYWRIDGEIPGFRLPAPCLGEHNVAVYQGLLGLDDAQYQGLLDDRLIGDTYLEGAELAGRDAANP
ncbi:MAG: CoA transferase [Chloroflexi bacterium]|nr:CoA transferase [Chloroflexota bacterium]